MGTREAMSAAAGRLGGQRFHLFLHDVLWRRSGWWRRGVVDDMGFGSWSCSSGRRPGRAAAPSLISMSSCRLPVLKIQGSSMSSRNGYLHKKVRSSLIHRDVRSSNVLVLDGHNGKIADLNQSPDTAARLHSSSFRVVLL